MSTPKLTADLLSIYQVAELLELSVSTVHQWDARGYLPAPILFGARYRWRFTDLHNWAAAGFPRRDLEQEQRRVKA